MTTKVSRRPQDVLWRARSLFRRRQFWLLASSTLSLALILWLLSEPLVKLVVRAGDARLWILSFGALAQLIYVAMFSLQILLAPVPGQFMAVTSGYLFGIILGSLYSIAGLMLGAGLAMLIARTFGRPLLERFFGATQLRMWEHKLSMRSPVTWWLLFLFPIPDLVFYAAGLTTIPLRWLFMALILGRGLGLILSNATGHLTASLSPEWVLVKWAIIFMLGVVVYLNQRQIRYFVLIAVRRIRRWAPPWFRRVFKPA